MGPVLFIVVCLLGLATGLASVELDEGERIRFGYRSIVWTFLMAMAVGLSAGESIGKRTTQISGGRDPEYETVEVRRVSDAQRWQRAETVSGQSFLPLAIGLAVSAAWVAFDRARHGAWTRKRLYQLRTGAVVGLVVGFFVVLRLILEG
jgi:hypothetical protein